MLNKSFYFKQVWAKGKLVCGYSSIKILGAVTAIVFERLNNAENKKIIEKIKNSMYELALDENGQPYKF